MGHTTYNESVSIPGFVRPWSYYPGRSARFRVRPSPISAAPMTSTTTAPLSIPSPPPVNGRLSLPVGVVGPSTVEPSGPLGVLVAVTPSTDVLVDEPRNTVDGEIRMLVEVFGLNENVVVVDDVLDVDVDVELDVDVEVEVDVDVLVLVDSRSRSPGPTSTSKWKWTSKWMSTSK